MCKEIGWLVDEAALVYAVGIPLEVLPIHLVPKPGGKRFRLVVYM